MSFLAGVVAKAATQLDLRSSKELKSNVSTSPVVVLVPASREELIDDVSNKGGVPLRKLLSVRLVCPPLSCHGVILTELAESNLPRADDLEYPEPNRYRPSSRATRSDQMMATSRRMITGGDHRTRRRRATPDDIG